MVGFGDLIRGMMYPSGNNAAWAIAEHVARAYFGAAAGVPEFVNLMNQHAAAEGLVDTHFANPNGFDDPNHYTTARELAKLMNHAITDPFFQAGRRLRRHLERDHAGAWWRDEDVRPLVSVLHPVPGLRGRKGRRDDELQRSQQRLHGDERKTARPPGRARLHAGAAVGRGDRAVRLRVRNHLPSRSERPERAARRRARQDDLDCLSSSRAVSAVVEPGGPAKLVVWSPDVGSATITKLARQCCPTRRKGAARKRRSLSRTYRTAT